MKTKLLQTKETDGQCFENLQKSHKNDSMQTNFVFEKHNQAYELKHRVCLINGENELLNECMQNKHFN